MEKIKVEQVIIGEQNENSENYEKFKKIVEEKNIKVTKVAKGDKIKIENNLNIEIIWPSNSNLFTDNSINNNSMVFKLNYKSFSCIFTGDIEEKAEQQILKEYKNNLNVIKATVLKVAHHGSKTSSTKEFLNAVKPKIALIGAGENNIFGHPNYEALKRLNEIGAKIYRTDQMGEITMTINAKCEYKIQYCKY